MGEDQTKEWPGAIMPALPQLAPEAGKPLRVRYVRVVANRYTALPTGFPGGAANNWLFVDEILVK